MKPEIQLVDLQKSLEKDGKKFRIMLAKTIPNNPKGTLPVEKFMEAFNQVYKKTKR